MKIRICRVLNTWHRPWCTVGYSLNGIYDEGDDDEDDGNVIALYVLMGRPVELKYRADHFLFSLKKSLKTSKKILFVHWLVL